MPYCPMAGFVARRLRPGGDAQRQYHRPGYTDPNGHITNANSHLTPSHPHPTTADAYRHYPNRPNRPDQARARAQWPMDGHR